MLTRLQVHASEPVVLSVPADHVKGVQHPRQTANGTGFINATQSMYEFRHTSMNPHHSTMFQGLGEHRVEQHTEQQGPTSLDLLGVAYELSRMLSMALRKIQVLPNIA